MNIFININANYYNIIKYVLKIIEKNTNNSFSFIESPEKADIIWDHTNSNSEFIYTEFYDSISNNNFSFNSIFNTSQAIIDKNDTEDIIASIFYMINCLQELNPDNESLDSFNRFKYEASYQAKFNSIEVNIVQKKIDIFCKKHKISAKKTKSTFFISHDIDTIYGSFLQDGFWAIKKLKIGVILNLIILELSKNSHWKNIDKIVKIDTEYDIRSTFFWLVNNGKGKNNILNADYKISKVKKLLNIVEQSNSSNGLHKSCSDMSLNDELKKEKKLLNYNRYHFLNFLPHNDWERISDSNIEFDGSLGFAEHYGFRNSYGKAFQPYNIAKNEPYNFIEAPLNFMDTTFHKYMKVPQNKISETIINTFEKNPYNCDFSLLWHNTYFTDYKYSNFIKEYYKIITYIYENKIESVTPVDLIKRNKLEW